MSTGNQYKAYYFYIVVILSLWNLGAYLQLQLILACSHYVSSAQEAICGRWLLYWMAILPYTAEFSP